MRTHAGTPGYQAPEVTEDGLCTLQSEIYSIGVSLIEIWTGVNARTCTNSRTGPRIHACIDSLTLEMALGRIWDGAETRGEGYFGMRAEMLDGLSKIIQSEPRVGKLLKKYVHIICLSICNVFMCVCYVCMRVMYICMHGFGVNTCYLVINVCMHVSDLCLYVICLLCILCVCIK